MNEWIYEEITSKSTKDAGNTVSLGSHISYFRYEMSMCVCECTRRYMHIMWINLFIITIISFVVTRTWMTLSLMMMLLTFYKWKQKRRKNRIPKRLLQLWTETRRQKETFHTDIRMYVAITSLVIVKTFVLGQSIRNEKKYRQFFRYTKRNLYLRMKWKKVNLGNEMHKNCTHDIIQVTFVL